MGTLSEQIANDLKSAMKNKEKEKLEAIRALKTAFLLAKSEKSATDVLSDADELKIVQKLVKQRKDSAQILVEKELNEVEVLSVYLPKQLSEEEVIAKLKEIITAVGASGPQDMGKVMGKATKELAGLTEGKLIAQKVKEILSSM